MKTAWRQKFVEGPGSLGSRARASRAELLVRTFPRLNELRVLDLGGTQSFWEQLAVRPKMVTAVNPVESDVRGETSAPWFRYVVGDACGPLDEFDEGEFDLAFSNSTIEHVGDRAQRQKFADVVHSMCRAHWIQTPNRAFPIEPHVLFPAEQFLPRQGRALVHRYWPLVHTNAKTWDSALRAADGTELLGRAEFRGLFPDSTIEDEKLVSWAPAKSLIAIRT